jgi:hypothetical protein
MNESSRFWWFVVLLMRLMLASFSCFFVAWMLMPVLGNWNHGAYLGGLTVVGMTICYTWAIYTDLPFFESCSKWQRLLLSIIFAILGAVITFFAVIVLFLLLFFPTPAD